MQTLAALFEKLAERTWIDIEDGERLNVTQGEEAITDRNLLEIKRAGHPSIKLIKTPKHLEAKRGIDWEWWIGSPRRGWLRYAVQAKRITPKNGRYDALGHLVKKKPQTDLLREYARTNRATPLYCFYNFLDAPNLPDYWQCGLRYDKKQLGCTITPLSVVQNALNTRGGRSFYWSHARSKAFAFKAEKLSASFKN